MTAGDPASSPTSEDERWMARALALAERGRGLCSPNPMVGAVVVSEGRLVGEGFHARAGGPHAEAEALRQAGDRARGATLYVTLEPCNHQGRTPPCVDAILSAGIRRVVVAAGDPNPRVRGGGARALRGAGLEVLSGCREDEARACNRVFIVAMERLRPHVTLKCAMTLDGKIAAVDRSARWITGEAARLEAHRLRSQSDAVMVGIGTVLLMTRRSPCASTRRGHESRCASWWIAGRGFRSPRASSIPALRPAPSSRSRTRPPPSASRGWRRGV